MDVALLIEIRTLLHREARCIRGLEGSVDCIETNIQHLPSSGRTGRVLCTGCKKIDLVRRIDQLLEWNDA